MELLDLQQPDAQPLTAAVAADARWGHHAGERVDVHAEPHDSDGGGPALPQAALEGASLALHLCRTGQHSAAQPAVLTISSSGELMRGFPRLPNADVRLAVRGGWPTEAVKDQCALLVAPP